MTTHEQLTQLHNSRDIDYSNWNTYDLVDLYNQLLDSYAKRRIKIELEYKRDFNLS
jgi:hypothetical protein